MDKILLIAIFIANTLFILTSTADASPFSKTCLFCFNNYSSFQNGKFCNAELIKDSDRFVRLSCNDNGFSREGTYISDIIDINFYANEIYPSWNIICPKNKAGFKIYLRVSSDSQEWSSWFYLGKWGKCSGEKNKVLKNDFGKVDIDSLYLSKKARYVQYSIKLFSSEDMSISPEIKLFAISCGLRDKKLNISHGKFKYYKSPGILNVPYRSQGAEDRKISGRICSPTSVSMVMDYWGISVPTSEVAKMSYSGEYDIYGIWPMAVQAASQYGFKGWVQIFKNWEEVEKEIAKGRPVIATISFNKNELEGSMTESSEGHVIVIRGFDNKGNPVCNDPAGDNDKEGIIIYNRKEIEKAWFWKSGVGYIIIKD